MAAVFGSVDQIFAGPRAPLRPIYDRIARAAANLGKDVTLEPRKAMVSIGRGGKQFAQALVPARNRIDLWLRLDGVESTDRLESPRSKPGMMTHRLALRAPSEVNAHALRWLRTAYARRG